MSLTNEPGIAAQLRLIEDRHAVYELQLRYAHLVDCGRHERVAEEIFTADAVIDYGTGPMQGRDAIHAFYTAFTGAIWGSAHILSNFSIEIEGDRARCLCRAMAWQWYRGANGETELRAADIMAIGGYQDELQRTANGWRISRRMCVQFGSGIGVGVAPDAIRPIFEGMLGRIPTWPE